MDAASLLLELGAGEADFGGTEFGCNEMPLAVHCFRPSTQTQPYHDSPR
jgi:hypothetical protein